MREIPKNALETIRVEQTTFSGIELVDVRIWTESNRTGQAVPCTESAL